MLVVTVVIAGAGPGSAAAAYTTVFYNALVRTRIGLIGDSTLTAVRLVAAYEPLRRYNFTLDAEECRRTTATSCGCVGGRTYHFAGCAGDGRSWS